MIKSDQYMEKVREVKKIESNFAEFRKIERKLKNNNVEVKRILSKSDNYNSDMSSLAFLVYGLVVGFLFNLIANPIDRLFYGFGRVIYIFYCTAILISIIYSAYLLSEGIRNRAKSMLSEFDDIEKMIKDNESIIQKMDKIIAENNERIKNVR